VVLNNVAHGRHEARIRQAIENHCHIPVLGAITRDEKLTIPDRHLGLVPREEEDSLLSAITACQQTIERHLDMDTILELARSAPPLSIPDSVQGSEVSDQLPLVKVGILRDRAFTFYYPENLEALEDVGAELVFIDAFCDTELPPVDALYIGGGFPEMFMEELSANAALRNAIRAAVDDNLPVYAECGGLMYLSQRIVWGDKSVEMVGALPCEVEMTAKPQGHGYVVAQVEAENPFFTPGTLLRGHEFHNSRIVEVRRTLLGEEHDRSNGALLNGRCDALTAYHLYRGNGLGDGRDGIIYRNVLASYTHLHSGGAPDWAKNLVRSAQRYRESRQQVRL
jgi:cobyrinic acid a,c-diamide synthase